jgi:hypothetical protein
MAHSIEKLCFTVLDGLVRLLQMDLGNAGSKLKLSDGATDS